MMKLVRNELNNSAGQERKPWAVVGTTGVIIREFYNREDACDWMDWTMKHPASAALL